MPRLWVRSGARGALKSSFCAPRRRDRHRLALSYLPSSSEAACRAPRRRAEACTRALRLGPVGTCRAPRRRAEACTRALRLGPVGTCRAPRRRAEACTRALRLGPVGTCRAPRRRAEACTRALRLALGSPCPDPPFCPPLASSLKVIVAHKTG